MQNARLDEAQLEITSLPGEISITSDMQMTESEEAKKFCLMAESEEEPQDEK